MDIGFGCQIADKFFPMGQPTGHNDAEGRPLYVGDHVLIRGCMAGTGIIGVDFYHGYALYFASKPNCSCSWPLNQSVCGKIRKAGS